VKADSGYHIGPFFGCKTSKIYYLPPDLLQSSGADFIQELCNF